MGDQVATGATITDKRLLISVAEFEEICSLAPTSGYSVIKSTPALKDAVVRIGRRGIRLNREKVERWARQQAA